MDRINDMGNPCAELLYQAFHIPVHLYGKSNAPEYATPLIPDGADPLKTKQELLSSLLDSLSHYPDQPVCYISAQGVMYSIAADQSEPEHKWILGPCLQTTPEKQEIERLAKSLKITDVNTFNFLTCVILPVLSVQQFSAVSQLMLKCVNNLPCFVQPPTAVVVSENDIAYREQSRQDTCDWQRPPVVDAVAAQKLFQCISRSDTAGCHSIINAITSRADRSSYTMERIRTECGSLLTQLSEKSVAAGIDAPVAMRILDNSISSLEKANSIRQIKHVMQTASVMLSHQFSARGYQLSSWLSRTEMYVSEHLHEKITLGDAAALNKLSISRFSELFKREAGITFGEYLQKQRICRAKTLLTYTQQSLVDISNDLCFCSQSYFTRVFKEACGITPQTYRKMRMGLTDPECRPMTAQHL